MKKRPLSITIVAWILIVFGILSGGSSLLLFRNPKYVEMMAEISPYPIWVQIGLLIFAILILIVSGFGFLKGQNWARFLYIGWSILAYTITLVNNQFDRNQIPGLLIFATVVFLLFRTASNEYFLEKN